MKKIVQSLPDVVEIQLYDLNEDDFIVDIDTYGYFLEEVFLKGVREYAEKKHKAEFRETGNVDPQTAVDNGNYNLELISKYWPKYDKIRDRFYLYKGNIYSYVPIGFHNVGLIIQVYKYDKSDLLSICNQLTRRKGIFKKLWEGFA